MYILRYSCCQTVLLYFPALRRANKAFGKVHGSLARAGKVRGQTPKVAKQNKKKKPRGRDYKHMQYNRRFVTAVVGFGKKRGPNTSEK
ncbi:40S ribosomal protein S30-like [Punica granatum]|uniref:40S ribosomal protein S30-like n=1 Tax=Punica granatum TaxID=22663 RepID=A0A6P8E5J8_PUNGR|nr:40S ribosomal protein S30-like [Punica granatum]